MKVMKLLTAAFFTVMPVTAFAMCSGHEQANACEDGYTWDSEAGACVEVVSS